MIIKSKFDGYQFVGQFVLTFMLVALIVVFYLGYFGQNAVKVFSVLGLFVFLLSVVLPAYIIAQMKLNYKKTTIDTETGTISFKMFLLHITQTYYFDHFDGYVSTTVTDKYSSYKCFYLVKDGKLQYKLSGRYYRNVDELHTGLSSCSKYLGATEFTTSLAVKIALGKPVLNTVGLLKK